MGQGRHTLRSVSDPVYPPVDQWKREVFRQFLNVMSDISLDHTASDCTQSENNSKDYKAHHSNRLVNLLISNLDTYSTDVRSLFKSTCSMLREAKDTSQKNNRNSITCITKLTYFKWGSVGSQSLFSNEYGVLSNVYRSRESSNIMTTLCSTQLTLWECFHYEFDRQQSKSQRMQ